jgi:PAT family beta-lactamase induction signal transducer AmpG
MTTDRPAGDTSRVTQIRSGAAAEAAGAAKKAPLVRRPGFSLRMRWVILLYFAEGFPYGVYLEVWSVYFRAHGVSLKAIGLLSLLGLPWTLKPLWAPLVDRYGDRRKWIAGCLVVMAILLALHPAFDAAHPGPAFWTILFLFTLASATQDVAIDGHTIAFVPKEETGAANGIRVSAYRAAMIVSGGGIVFFAGFIGWPPVWWAAAALLLILAVVVLRAPGGVARIERPRNFFAPLLAWASLPGSAAAIAFVLLYKLGDQAITPMIKPFWIDRGLSLKEVGLVSTSLGIAFTVFGALVGGFLTTKWGLIRALFILGIAQVLPNLGYAACAAFDVGRYPIYAVSILESFGQGLGTACFLTFMMRLCDPAQAGTQYALISSLFALTRHISGGVSGFAATRFGYAAFFAYTFLLAFPGLALIPFVRRRLEEADRIRALGEAEAAAPEPAPASAEPG